jgi:predicted DNA-binding protein (UPF0251 family)
MSNNDWQSKRSMAPKEYERVMEQLGLNQAQAGRWLGVSERTSRRYVAGEAEIPAAQVLLLRAALSYRIDPVVPPWRRDAN